jgi:hypothetical protein
MVSRRSFSTTCSLRGVSGGRQQRSMCLRTSLKTAQGWLLSRFLNENREIDVRDGSEIAIAVAVQSRVGWQGESGRDTWHVVWMREDGVCSAFVTGTGRGEWEGMMLGLQMQASEARRVSVRRHRRAAHPSFQYARHSSHLYTPQSEPAITTPVQTLPISSRRDALPFISSASSAAFACPS